MFTDKDDFLSPVHRRRSLDLIKTRMMRCFMYLIIDNSSSDSHQCLKSDWGRPRFFFFFLFVCFLLFFVFCFLFFFCFLFVFVFVLFCFVLFCFILFFLIFHQVLLSITISSPLQKKLQTNW